MVDLSRSLLRDFAALTKWEDRQDVQNTLRGTIVVEGENKYVAIDGSPVKTPMSEIIDARHGDRVMVTIENHKATVVGNISKPPSAYKEQEAISKIDDTSRTLGTQISETKHLAETKVNELSSKVSNFESTIGNKLDNIEQYDKKIDEATKKADETRALLDKDKSLKAEQLKAINDSILVMEQELAARAAIDTVNAWIKSFEAMIKAGENERKQAERDLITMSSRMELIQANLENMTAVWNAVDANMKFSNEGLAIGDRSGDSYIMVKPRRISMFSSGSEVMYISNGVIHIDNGVFTKSIQIGYYVTSQYEANPKINVLRYVGPR